MAAPPGVDAAALQRGLAVARVAVAAAQAAQRRQGAAGAPPAVHAGAALPREERGRPPAAAPGGAAPFALRRRRPAPVAASRDASPGPASSVRWRSAARRPRGKGKPAQQQLDAVVLLDSSAAAAERGEEEDDEGSDTPLLPPGDSPDAAVDRRPPGADGGIPVAPRWFANSGKAHTYDVVRIDKLGATVKQELKRRELLRQTGLPARDLRRIDPALSLTTSAPTLLVSDTVLLINLGQVRVIVSRDHALLFEPNTRVASNFLEGLLTRLEQSPGAGASDASGDGDGSGGGSAADSDGAGAFAAPPAPFELEVVEAALLEVTGQLDALLLDASARVSALLRLLPQRLAITADVLEELRLVKQSLVELDSRAGAIRSLLLEVLDDEEDVRGMMLSREAAAPPEEVEEAEDEVENLLEYYLQRCETCHGEAERLLENTRDLEESISVSLSARRFEVNKLELMLSIATFATAVGALVAGIFGMNLRNRFEMSVGAFYGTAMGIMLGVVVLCGLLYRYTRRKRIL